MARLASLAFLLSVLVVFPVAGIAVMREFLPEGFILVAHPAFHVDAFVVLRKVLVMIEVQPLPASLVMTFFACRAQRSLVPVLSGMTGTASLARLAIFFPLGMAVPARDFLRSVPSNQPIAGLFPVIEFLRIDIEQVRVASLVFVVAFAALLIFLMPSVQAALVCDVLRNLPVTAFTQLGLRHLVEVFVTVAASILEFCVIRRHMTG